MARPGEDIGIAQSLSRVSETLGRLASQHLELLRVEVAQEGRAFAARTGARARAVGIAAPFVASGVALVSLGAALALAAALRGLVGAAALPLALVAVGLTEAGLAWAWLRGRLEKAARASGPDAGAPERAAAALRGGPAPGEDGQAPAAGMPAGERGGPKMRTFPAAQPSGTGGGVDGAAVE